MTSISAGDRIRTLGKITAMASRLNFPETVPKGLKTMASAIKDDCSAESHYNPIRATIIEYVSVPNLKQATRGMLDEINVLQGSTTPFLMRARMSIDRASSMNTGTNPMARRDALNDITLALETHTFASYASFAAKVDNVSDAMLAAINLADPCVLPRAMCAIIPVAPFADISPPRCACYSCSVAPNDVIANMRSAVTAACKTQRASVMTAHRGGTMPNAASTDQKSWKYPTLQLPDAIDLVIASQQAKALMVLPRITDSVTRGTLTAAAGNIWTTCNKVFMDAMLEDTERSQQVIGMRAGEYAAFVSTIIADMHYTAGQDAAALADAALAKYQDIALVIESIARMKTPVPPMLSMHRVLMSPCMPSLALPSPVRYSHITGDACVDELPANDFK